MDRSIDEALQVVAGLGALVENQVEDAYRVLEWREPLTMFRVALVVGPPDFDPLRVKQALVQIRLCRGAADVVLGPGLLADAHQPFRPSWLQAIVHRPGD